MPAQPKSPPNPQPDQTTAASIGAVDYISGLVENAVSQATVPLDTSIFQSIAPSAPSTRTVACMVTHGMGQQVPFETAASIAEAFVRGRQPVSRQVNRVLLSTAPDANLISRIELQYAATATAPAINLHIYEGYWAPLTEGKITYVQALQFLFSGALAGFHTALKHKFSRWIFNDMRELPVKKHTTTVLILVLLFLLLGLGLAALAAVQINHAWTVLKHLLEGPFRALPAALLHAVTSHPAATLRTAVIVALGFVYRYFLHLFVIEYLGDVAIYVSSFKVSVFEDVRNAIQKTVFTIGSQIFAANDPASDPANPRPLYDKVIFVGHSLGSVITYDLINALIAWDTHACSGQHNVVSRISRFITFGSPLDKTAFLFRNQPSQDLHFREAMAALMQPLVLDYALRPFPWVNLYSRKDIVSGYLQYYDFPNPDTPAPTHGPSVPRPPGYNPVQNHPDPAAHTPIYAHLQYWNGQALADQLIRGL